MIPSAPPTPSAMCQACASSMCPDSLLLPQGRVSEGKGQSVQHRNMYKQRPPWLPCGCWCSLNCCQLISCLSGQVSHRMHGAALLNTCDLFGCLLSAQHVTVELEPSQNPCSSTTGQATMQLEPSQNPSGSTAGQAAMRKVSQPLVSHLLVVGVIQHQLRGCTRDTDMVTRRQWCHGDMVGTRWTW